MSRTGESNKSQSKTKNISDNKDRDTECNTVSQLFERALQEKELQDKTPWQISKIVAKSGAKQLLDPEMFATLLIAAQYEKDNNKPDLVEHYLLSAINNVNNENGKPCPKYIKDYLDSILPKSIVQHWFPVTFGKDVGWATYNLLYSNIEYYRKYYTDYTKENQSFFKDLISVFKTKETLNVLIMGGGNGCELVDLESTIKSTPSDIKWIKCTVVDDIVWPLNKFNQPKSSIINSITIRLGKFDEILKQSNLHEFDIIYFPRSLNFVDMKIAEHKDYVYYLLDIRQLLIEYTGTLAFGMVDLDGNPKYAEFLDQFDTIFQERQCVLKRKKYGSGPRYRTSFYIFNNKIEDKK